MNEAEWTNYMVAFKPFRKEGVEKSLSVSREYIKSVEAREIQPKIVGGDNKVRCVQWNTQSGQCMATIKGFIK